MHFCIQEVMIIVSLFDTIPIAMFQLQQLMEKVLQ